MIFGGLAPDDFLVGKPEEGSLLVFVLWSNPAQTFFTAFVVAFFWARVCVVWLVKMLASGWGSLCESSSFVPWFVSNAFQDISRAVPEWPWISGLMRKSSRCDNATNMRFFELLRRLLCDSSLNFFGNLIYVVLLRLGNTRVLSPIAPKMFLTIFLVCCCQFPLVSKSCHFYGKVFFSD